MSVVYTRTLTRMQLEGKSFIEKLGDTEVGAIFWARFNGATTLLEEIAQTHRQSHNIVYSTYRRQFMKFQSAVRSIIDLRQARQMREPDKPFPVLVDMPNDLKQVKAAVKFAKERKCKIVLCLDMWPCKSYGFTVQSTPFMRQWVEKLADEILFLIPDDEKKKLIELRNRLLFYKQRP